MHGLPRNNFIYNVRREAQPYGLSSLYDIQMSYTLQRKTTKKRTDKKSNNGHDYSRFVRLIAAAYLMQDPPAFIYTHSLIQKSFESALQSTFVLWSSLKAVKSVVIDSNPPSSSSFPIPHDPRASALKHQ